MKFLLGLFLGLGLGIIAGLLLAPQSGEATMAQLNQQGVMLRDRSGEVSQGLRSRATDALAQGRELYTRTRGEMADRLTKVRAGQL